MRSEFCLTILSQCTDIVTLTDSFPIDAGEKVLKVMSAG
jgi:hypothetical protein